MNVRSIAATAAALGLVLAGSAAAASRPKSLCNLLTDPAGDTFAVRAQEEYAKYGPQDDSLDVVSADIATNAKTITGVVRLAKAAKAGETSPTGNGYTVEFFLPGSGMAMSLRALYTATGDHYEASFVDTRIPGVPSTLLGQVTGTFDARRREVRISAPLALFADHSVPKKGQSIFELAAYSGRVLLPPAVAVPGQPITPRFLFADVAEGGREYPIGATSCVPIGT